MYDTKKRIYNEWEIAKHIIKNGGKYEDEIHVEPDENFTIKKW